MLAFSNQTPRAFRVRARPLRQAKLARAGSAYRLPPVLLEKLLLHSRVELARSVNLNLGTHLRRRPNFKRLRARERLCLPIRWRVCTSLASARERMCLPIG